MIAGTLEIQMLANLARLQKDMEQAKRMVGGATSTIERMAGRARDVLGMIGVGVGSAAVAAYVRTLLNGVDALNDWRDATGASVENMSALEQLALRNGAAVIKFNKVLAEAKPGSGADAILSSMGLSAEALRRMDPAQALHLTAQALNRYADDGNKARIVQEFFGKSIKEAGPFLKDLGEQTQLVGKVTTEEAQRVEDFNKVIFRLKTDAMDLSREGILAVVTAFYNLKKAAEDANGPLLVLAGTVAGMATGGAFAALAVGAKALWGVLAGLAAFLLANPALLAVLGVGAAVGAGIGYVRAQAATQEGVQDAIAALEAANERSEQAFERAAGREKAQANIRRVIDERKKQIALLRGELVLLGTAAQNVDGSYDALEARRLSQPRKESAPAVTDTAAVAAARKAYEGLLEPVRERIRLQRAELSAGRELTDQERFAQKVLGDLAKQKIALESPRGKAIQQLLAESAALDASSQRRDARLKQLQAEAAAISEIEDEQGQAQAEESRRREQVRLSIDEYARGIDDASRRLQVEREAMGQSNQVRDVMLQKLEAQLALERQLRGLGFDDGMDEAQREEARAKLRSAHRRQVQDIEERATMEQDRERTLALSSSISEGILDGFRHGQSFADIFLRELKAQFAKTILEPRIRPMVAAGNKILDDVLGGLGTALKSALGGGGGPATGADMDLFYSDYAGSFAGGGYTGNAARAGGLDGQGGFWAMLHPQETVIDHAAGQQAGAPVINQKVSIKVDSDTDRGATIALIHRALRENNKAVFDELMQRR